MLRQPKFRVQNDLSPTRFTYKRSPAHGNAEDFVGVAMYIEAFKNRYEVLVMKTCGRALGGSISLLSSSFAVSDPIVTEFQLR